MVMIMSDVLLLFKVVSAPETFHKASDNCLARNLYSPGIDRVLKWVNNTINIVVVGNLIFLKVKFLYLLFEIILNCFEITF